MSKRVGHNRAVGMACLRQGTFRSRNNMADLIDAARVYGNTGNYAEVWAFIRWLDGVLEIEMTTEAVPEPYEFADD